MRCIFSLSPLQRLRTYDEVIPAHTYAFQSLFIRCGVGSKFKKFSEFTGKITDRTGIFTVEIRKLSLFTFKPYTTLNAYGDVRYFVNVCLFALRSLRAKRTCMLQVPLRDQREIDVFFAKHAKFKRAPTCFRNKNHNFKRNPQFVYTRIT